MFIVEAGELISLGSKPFLVEAGELNRHTFQSSLRELWVEDFTDVTKLIESFGLVDDINNS